MPSWLSFNTNTYVLSGVSGSGDVGPHSVTLQVGDGEFVDQQVVAIEVVASGSGYEAWAIANSVPGGPLDDRNDDGLDNLSEYAMGEKPKIVKTEEGYTYLHKQRSGDSSLGYVVQMTTNLTADSWESIPAAPVTNGVGGTYDSVTRSLIVEDPCSYIRLKITKP
jgi:hypothetical protein